MAIHAMWEGKAQKPRLVPDFQHGVTFFDLFTTIPVIATAFGCHVNGKLIVSLFHTVLTMFEVGLMLAMFCFSCNYYYYNLLLQMDFCYVIHQSQVWDNF